MKKVYLLLFILTFGALSQTGYSQCSILATATLTTPTITGGSSYTKYSVAYNPSLNLYYSLNGSYVQTHNSTGAILNSYYSPSLRSIWWNGNTNQLEGNGYSSLGIVSFGLNASGYVASRTVIFSGSNHQPNSNAQGAYDPSSNEIIYMQAITLHRYSRATGNFIGTVSFFGFGIGSGFSPSIYNIVYTGCSGKEVGMYDRANQRLLFINKSTGMYVGSSQLPASAPTLNYYSVSFINDKLFVSNGTSWFSYDVLNQGLQTSSISGPFCDNSSVSINFSLNSLTFNSGNIFTAQLSDASGNFSSPITLGSVTSTTATTISGNIPVNTPAGSNYRIRVVSSNPVQVGTDNGSNITVNVPAVNLGSNVSICPGDTALLSAPLGVLSYNWSTGGTNQTYAATTAGTYSVTVSNSVCSKSDTIVVSLLAQPSPTLSDTNTLCASSVSLNPGSFSSYLWSTGATSSSITATTSGSFTVTVTGSNTCTAVDSSFVNLLNPEISTGDTAICAGDTLDMSTASGCYFVLSSISSTSSYNATSYYAAGDDRGGMAVTQNYLYYTGDNYTARYNTNLTNYTSLSRRDGIFSDLSTGQLYTFWNTTYNGFTNSNAYTSAINSIRTMDASLNYTGSVINLSQTINAGYYSYVFAGSGFVVLWSNYDQHFYKIELPTGNVVDLGNYNLANVRYNTENWASWGVAECNGTDYSFVFRANTSSSLGTSANEITRFNLSNSTFSTASSFSNLSLGDMACITYSPWNNRWYYQSEYSTTFGSLNENIGYASANHNGVGGSNSINNYSWSTSATTPTISVSPSTTTNYSVTVSHGAVSCSDTVTVTVNALPSMSLSDTMSFCNLDSVQISSPGTYSTYLWSTGSTSSTTYVSGAGVYDLQVSNSNNCFTTDSTFVNFLDARIEQNDTTLCSADSLDLNVGSSTCGFEIQTMGITNKYSVYNQSGSHHGGIAVSQNYIYTNGYNYCSRYDLTLNSYTNLARRDGIFSDLASGQLYTLWSTTANGFSSTNYTSYSNINAIRRMDASLNYGTIVMLSQTINAGLNSFVAVGTGFVLIWANTNNTLYRIDLYTGDVEDLGVQNSIASSVYFYNGWASYGIAECTANGYSVIAHVGTNLGTGSYRSIGRYSVTTGVWSQAAPTVDAYSSMTDLIYSKWNNKWYFSHPTSRSGLGSYSPSIGYADATSTNSGGAFAGSSLIGSILWSTSDTIPSIVVSPNTSTNYSVTVTNGSHSCSDTVSVTVIQSPTVTETVNSLSCYGDTNSSASLAVTGGTTPYTYAWSSGGTTSSLSNLASGSYLYTVTGNNGCEIIDSVIVTGPTQIISISTINSSASCYGSTDGSATVSVTGGTPGYTYLWPSGQTNATDTQVAGGDNIVTITDANSCVIYDTVLVTSPMQIDSAGPITSTTTFYCPGTSGNLVAANAGVGTITRTLNRSSSNQSPTPYYNSNMDFVFNSLPGNSTGSITVTVHFQGELNSSYRYLYVYDENNNYRGRTRYNYAQCSNAGSAVFTFSSSYLTSWLADGAITFRLTPYNYSSSYCTMITSIDISYNYISNVKNYWFVGTPSTDSTLAIGSGTTISVTPQVTTTYYASNFAAGCNSQFDSITVIVPPAPSTAYIMNPTSICAGETTAIQAYGAASYTWPNDPTITGSGATVSITPLATTNYLVTITNAFNCSYVDTVNIPVSPSPTGNVLTTNNTSCSNANDGQAVVYATGGISPYTYNWSNGSSGALQLNLAAGTYIITVTGSNSCFDTMSVTVGGPVPMDYNATVNDITCNGQINGSISLAVTGGNSPYSYIWSNGATTNLVSNLSAGSYSVTVTDNTSCTADTTFTISEPTALIASITGTTPETCAGLANGSITSTAMGGTAPYTFVWDNGGTTSMLTSLSGGTYNLTVTDANGCTSTISATVSTTPTTLALGTGSVNNVLCYNGTDGSALATASGGVTPYSYSWSNGNTNASLSNVAAGTYSVTVTDGNSCQDVSSVTVTEPMQLVVSNNVVTNASCFGLTNGSATISVSGGTTAYGYLWPDATTQALNANLGAGSYVVTVTDANSCTETTTVSVTEPTEIVLSPTVTDITCNGLTDGAITTSVSGGTAMYSYSWSNAATTSGISGLTLGSYAVTVTDANNCTADSSFTISQPNTMTASIGSSTDVACKGSATGNATAAVVGGTMPYIYAWSNTGTFALNSNLLAGLHTVTITDANGCIDSSSVTLTEPATLLTVSIPSATDVLCNSLATGDAIALAVDGGTSYNFVWSNGATTPAINGLTAGAYTVSVTDSYGCEKTSSVTITEPTAISLTLAALTNVTCNGMGNGAATINVSGGTSAYSYLWSNGSATNTISSVSPGSYTMVVTDANSCVDSATITITEPTALTLSVTSSQNVACNGSATGFAIVDGAGGTNPYTYLWASGTTGNTITNQSAGFYNVTVTDDNGCIDSLTVNLSQPTSLSLSVNNSSNNACYGDAQGTASVAVVGGSTPYIYAWPNGVAIDTSSALTAGNYIVTVTDANSCQDTTLVSITQPDSISISVSSQTNPLCNGDQNGSVGINVTGGTPSYSYLWSNTITDTLISNVVAGNYTITVTDANSCTNDLTVQVTEPALLASTFAVSNVLCNSDTNGSVASTVTGGVLPYTYVWSNSSTMSSLTNLGAGSYVVTITDANGCADTTTNVVSEPMQLVNTLSSSTDVNCNGDFTGTATTATTGGTSPYSFAWTGGQTVESPTNLGAGVNTITVTDANGCIDSTLVTTLSLSNLSLAIVSANDVLCNGDTNGNITVSATGGSGTTNYSWATLTSTDSSLVNIGVGTYISYVSDNLGCADTLSITINEPALITGYSVTQQNPLCFGDSSGWAEVSALGGVGSFTYLWASGDTTSADSMLTSGVHSVTITDSNSCFNTYDVYLTDPAQLLTTQFITTNVNCAFDATGSAVILTSGGAAPNTYLWDNGQTSNTATNLTAGNYSVIVTDANGCLLMDTTTVNSTNPLTPSGLPNDTMNCGSDVTLTANSAFVGFSWSTGSTSSFITVTNSGTISFSGLDANGCYTFDTLDVSIFPAVSVNLGADISNICEGTPQILDAGNGFIIYNWSNGDTTATITVLTSGTYVVTATDTNGCMATDDVDVAMMSLPIIDLGADTVGCTDKGITSIPLDAGTGFTSYLWSTGSTNQIETVTAAGDYSVEVENSNGCKNSDTINVTFDVCSSVNDLTSSLNISIYPNPTRGDLNVDLNGLMGEMVEIEIVTTNGQLVKSVKIDSRNQSEVHTQIDLNDVAQGLYFVIIKSNDQQKIERISIY